MANSKNASAAGGDWLEEDMDGSELLEAAAEPVVEPVVEPVGEPVVEPVVEPETTPKPDPDGPVVETPDAKQVSQQIPKKRFDQVNNRLKEAEKRLREINDAQARQAQAQATGEVAHDADWFDSREEAYMAAVINGDTSDAKTIRQEIRAAEETKYQAYADQTSARTAKAVPDAQAVGVIVAALETAFPELDKTSDVYDSLLVSDVLALQRSYLQNDTLISPADALEKAAQRLGMDLGGDAAPAPAAARAKPAGLTDASAAVAAANAQPPPLGSRAGFDNGESTIDWDNFTDEDFDKLPLSKQKELRGDGG